MTTVQENLKDDILQEIPHQQIPSLLEMLKKDWPASILIHNYIKNFWDWECKDSSRKCHVLVPHGSWECGTVILIVPYSLYTVAVYSPPEDHGYLERVLCTTNWIDWESPSYILFPGMLPSHKEAVMTAVKFRRLRLPIQTTQCLAYWMPHWKAAQLTTRCPLEVYIGPLNESHLDTVISHWEYGSQETRALILNLLRLNTCLGLYLANNHQLVAWVLSTEYGVGVLHTMEHHRRRGYGRLVLISLMKLLGQQEIDIHLHVGLENTASNNLMKSIGCQAMGIRVWLDAYE